MLRAAPVPQLFPLAKAEAARTTPRPKAGGRKQQEAGEVPDTRSTPLTTPPALRAAAAAFQPCRTLQG